MAKINYRINQNIKAKEVRLIDQDGKQLGVLETSKALEKAKKAGLDLVEVAAVAKPPVARLLNFHQFLREKNKQERVARKFVKTDLKEIRIRPNIDEADLNIRARRAKEFLKKRYRVKLTVVYRGREIAHPEVGLEKINKLLGMLVEDGKTTGDPKRMGRTVEVILIPKNEKG